MNIIIFAGGVGSRLWPLSRKNTPKQFEQILGHKSTLQLAVDRLQPDFSWENMYVATGEKFVEIVGDQLSLLPKNHIIGEPEMRDVGPAVALMAGILSKTAPKEPMAILWSDHLVKKEDHFRKLLKTAGEIIKENPNKIIFLAQKPRFPSVNLGWINFGKEQYIKNDIKFHSFKSFKYRPNEEEAKEYYNSGHHGWNLGYFVTTPEFLLSQFKMFAPELYKNVSLIYSHWGSDSFYKQLKLIYPTLDKIHFDNVVLEKLKPEDALVICENIEWSDIGAWEALKEALSEEAHENVTRGNVLVEGAKDSLLFNFTNQLVVGLDVEEMVVVNTGDVLLVCPKKSVGKIKKLVQSLSGTAHEHLI